MCMRRSVRRAVLGGRRRRRRPDLLDKAASPRRSSRIRRIQRDRRRLNRDRRRETGRERMLLLLLLLARSSSSVRRRRIRSFLAAVMVVLMVVVVNRRQERQQRRGFDRHVLHLGERFRYALDRDGALRLPRREMRTARVGPAGTSSAIRRRRRQHPRPFLGGVHPETASAACACATARSRRTLARMIVLHRRSERVRAIRRHGTRRAPAGLRIEVLCPHGRRRGGRPLTTLRLDLTIVFAPRFGRCRNRSRVRRSLTDHVADAPSRRAEPFGRIIAQRFRRPRGLARLPRRRRAAAATPPPSEVEFLLLEPDVVFPTAATCIQRRRRFDTERGVLFFLLAGEALPRFRFEVLLPVFARSLSALAVRATRQNPLRLTG